MAWSRFAFLSALTVIAFSPPAVKAQSDPSRDCPNLVSLAFAATGTDEEIRSMPAAIQNGVAAQMQVWASLADRQRVTQAVARAFNPEQIDLDFRAEFTSSCDTEMLRSVIGAMNVPLTMRMRRMEAAAKSPQARPQLERFVDELTLRQPQVERMRLIGRLDQATGCRELIDGTFKAVSQGFRDAGAAGADFQLPRPVVDKIHNMTLVSWLFAYRDVGDPELARYVEMMETPAFRKFNALVRRAFLGVMTTQSRAVGRELAAGLTSARH